MHKAWISVDKKLPAPWQSVQVRAKNVMCGDVAKPDGEYIGFWDSVRKRWSCYAGTIPQGSNLCNCEVLEWCKF